MARKLPPDGKPFDVGRKKDGKYIGRYTHTGDKSSDGRNAGSWEASDSPYLRRYTPGDALNRVIYEYHGTPGRVNDFKPQRALVRDTRTNIEPSGIIINEVANRNEVNNQYEWIELRNVHATDEVNLNNYQISILTGVGKDEQFIILPNNNNAKIPAGGVLVLTDSDPYGDDDHPLAVGWDVDKNAEDQVPGLASLGINATSKHGRYKVMTFGGKGNKHLTGLPDDGNFILVMRSPDNHENKNEGGKGPAELGANDVDATSGGGPGIIVDIAGYVGGLTKDPYTNSVSKTSLWPLKNQGTPDDKNRLTANKVRFRRNVSTRNGRAGTGNTHNDRKVDQLAFKDVGYSGIGYKRQAANNAMHGGTPGYDNGVQKGSARDADIGTAKLVISEIMLSQGAENARTKLPQWIEIYNPNDLAVNLVGYEFSYVFKKKAHSIQLRHFLIPPESAIILTTHIPHQRHRYEGISELQVYNLKIENALKKGWSLKDLNGTIISQTGKIFGETENPIMPPRVGLSRVSQNVYGSENSQDPYFFGFRNDVSSPGFYEPQIPRSPALLRQRMKTTWASFKKN
jgi:hypothetical protein